MCPRQACRSVPVVAHHTLTSVSSLPVTMDRPVLSKITQYSSLRWPLTVVRGFTREPSSDGGHPAARRRAAAAPPPALKVCASRTASRNVSFGSETALPNRDEVGSLIPDETFAAEGRGMRLAGPAPTSVRKPLAARSRPAGVSDAARPTSLARWSGATCGYFARISSYVCACSCPNGSGRRGSRPCTLASRSNASAASAVGRLRR